MFKRQYNDIFGRNDVFGIAFIFLFIAYLWREEK